MVIGNMFFQSLRLMKAAARSKIACYWKNARKPSAHNRSSEEFLISGTVGHWLSAEDVCWLSSTSISTRDSLSKLSYPLADHSVLSGKISHLIGQSVDGLHQVRLGLHILLMGIPQVLHHILQLLVFLRPFILAFNKEVYHWYQLVFFHRSVWIFRRDWLRFHPLQTLHHQHSLQ